MISKSDAILILRDSNLIWESVKIAFNHSNS
jgi:hypothetical protein